VRVSKNVTGQLLLEISLVKVGGGSKKRGKIVTYYLNGHLGRTSSNLYWVPSWQISGNIRRILEAFDSLWCYNTDTILSDTNLPIALYCHRVLLVTECPRLKFNIFQAMLVISLQIEHDSLIWIPQHKI